MEIKKSLFLLFFLPLFGLGQQKFTADNVHSHNDYAQAVPFYNAFELNCGSIEADVYLKDGELFVAHQANEIKPENTLKRLYLNVLEEKRKQKKLYELQLLIDLKTAVNPTLDTLVGQLAQYPKLFGKKGKIKVVISGNMPKPEDFEKYPDWIFFDGRFGQNYSEKALKRIALMSTSMLSVALWNGKRDLTPEEQAKISKFVTEAHQLNKKIRFWATPDTPAAWQQLMALDVDWLGTDQPTALVEFLKQK